MALAQLQIEKPLRKLRKLMKKLSVSPSPKNVHELRTSTRRVEAIAAALSLKERGDGRTLLKELRPTRKKAGQVRDLDVFMHLASTLKDEAKTDSRIQLLEYLGAERAHAAKALHSKVEASLGKIKPVLKDALARIRKDFRKSEEAQSHRQSGEAGAATAALLISRELAKWPELTTANLHLFRKKTKQLRYLLQLSDQSDDRFLKTLGEVKDAIGEWHDWAELKAMAAKALKQEQTPALLKEIRKREKEKLEGAMRDAARLLEHSLRAPQGKTKFSSGDEALHSAAHLIA